MKHLWITKGLALLAALALSLPVAGWAEELGEIDLYDPSVYIDEAQLIGPVTEQPLEDAVQPQSGSGSATGPDEPAPQEAAGEAESPEGALVESGASYAPVEGGEGVPEGEASYAPVEGGEGLPEGEASYAPVEGGEGFPADEAAVAAPELAAGEEVAVAAPQAEPNLYMGLGEQYPLDGTALFGGAGTAAVYASDRPDIAAVDPQSGVITAVATGTARLTVTADTGAMATYVVAVLNMPDALSFPASKVVLGKGEQSTLTAFAPPGTACAWITYKSSKPKVATVDAAGNVTAKKVGTATITATAYNGAKAVCKVKVRKAPSRLKLSAKTAILCLGETRKLSVKLPGKSASRITWESDDPAVVEVDADGNLRGVGSGVANITARSFNGKRAVCKVAVLDGAAPTTLALNAQALQLGVKEKFQLTPLLGEGEAAVFKWSTSKKRVATVSSNGLVTAKRKGTAVITVKTHNGLKVRIKVKVGKAPSKVTLSASELAMEVGQTAQLSAKLPAKTAGSLIWQSSDASVASVDGSGLVTALGAGTALVSVTTFNGKTAQCKVTVFAPAIEDQQPIAIPDPGAQAASPTAQQMLANLKASKILGGKADAIINVMSMMIGAGFEPAFAAGVGANIYSEGTYGMFESSKYVANYLKRPKYFCYLDGGDYYTLKDSEYVLTAVYMSQEELDVYTGEAEGRLRFGPEKYYWDNFSGKSVWNVSLSELEALMEALAAGGWQGKFGLGIVQWTGGRTKKLVGVYRKYAGDGDTLTKEQVITAENEMILNDFRGSYNSVYTAWKSANTAAPDTVEAASSAGSLVCLRYEIPANKEEKAVKRGNKAAEMYKAMIGG